MKRSIGVALLCLVSLDASSQAIKASAQSRLDVEHTKWIETVLLSIETVKAGATRAELLKIFTEEGGLSNPSQRTYVYRHCPYIKVDVKFAPSSNQNELPTDKVVEISHPYLYWSIMD
jgi:hypothetical protein